MSALNNEYSVLEQDPHPQGPLYSLLVKLILSPNYFNARELYWYLVETNANPFTPLTNDQVMLRDSLYFLMEILQYDRNLNTSNPLWLLVLRQVQFLAQPPKSMPVKKMVYVLRRMANNPMKYGVFVTDSPRYTEQAFPSQAMAEYALYRNQPFASVYDNYMDNTPYGTSAPKYFRRIVSVPERSKSPIKGIY